MRNTAANWPGQRAYSVSRAQQPLICVATTHQMRERSSQFVLELGSSGLLKVASALNGNLNRMMIRSWHPCHASATGTGRQVKPEPELQASESSYWRSSHTYY